jgi:hypothetical protein
MYKAKLNSKQTCIVVLIMHSEHPNISKHKKHYATVNLGFDLADVVGEQNSVNLKFPGKLTVSAGIESRKWLIGGK